MRTAKTFALTLTLAAVLAAPVFAAGHDGAKRIAPPRETSAITRVIDRLTQLVRALGETLVVPQPVSSTSTTT